MSTMGADMNRLPCRYAVVQFLPFTETGEFANVGILLACPATGYLGYKLQTRRWGRVTAFFDEIRANTFKGALKAFGLELDRVRQAVANLPADGRRADAVRQIFTQMVHPREALMRFSQPRALLTENVPQALEELFAHYVDRNFATPEYVEVSITRRLQTLLRSVKLVAPFKGEQLGDDEVHARFALVQTVDGRHSKVIKPFNLSQAEPNDILEHGDAWVTKVRRLRQRQLLPQAVMFTVQAPPDTDTRRYRAFNDICAELQLQGVTVVDQTADSRILAFAQQA